MEKSNFSISKESTVNLQSVTSTMIFHLPSPLLMKALWFSLGYHSSSTFSSCSWDGPSGVGIGPSQQTPARSTLQPQWLVMMGEERHLTPGLTKEMHIYNIHRQMYTERLLLVYFERGPLSPGIARQVGHWPGAASSHPRCHLGRIFQMAEPHRGGQSWELERRIFESTVWAPGCMLALNQTF